MEHDPFPVSRRLLKRLETYWATHSYSETVLVPAEGRSREIVRCDFPYIADGVIDGWLTGFLDSEHDPSSVSFSGDGTRSVGVYAPTLKMLLAGIVDKIRLAKGMIRNLERQLVEIRTDAPRAAEARNSVQAEIARWETVLTLGESALEAVSEFYEWISGGSVPTMQPELLLEDARDRIGPWLGYSCGPPPPARIRHSWPTRSLAVLSGVLDEGPHVDSDAYAAEFDYEEG